MDWIAAIGGLAGVVSAFVAWVQWRKVNRKIGMLSDVSKAAEVLPAWYTTRMMTDHWLFGLLTTDGRTLAITKIKAVSDDGVWMDVELATRDDFGEHGEQLGTVVYAVAADRIDASIRIASIVAAVELISG